MRVHYSAMLRLPPAVMFAAAVSGCSHACAPSVPIVQGTPVVQTTPVGQGTPVTSPTPSASITATPQPNTSQSPGVGATPLSTPSSGPLPMPAPSPAPTASPSPMPTAAPTPVPTPTLVPTPTPVPTIAPVTTLTQTFAGNNVNTTDWQVSGYSCLTAGSGTTPTTSIPACPSLNDANGSGFLRISSNAMYSEGFAVSQVPVILQAGHTALTVSFDYYAYGGNGADGLSVFLLDATQPIPTSPGTPGGGLGYAGITSGYVAAGLDSFGNFSNVTGGPGRIPQTITIRGGAGSGFAYIGGYLSAGIPASLPFHLDSTLAARPTPLSVSVTFHSSPATVSVQIDRHDGSGLITYVNHASLSVAGQPAFPSRVYLGFSASNGDSVDYHEIGNVTITPS